MPWPKGKARAPGNMKARAPDGLKDATYELRKALGTGTRDPLRFLARIIGGEQFAVTVVVDGEAKEVKMRPTIEQRISAAKACINKLYPDLRASEVQMSQQTDIRQLSREELMIIAGEGAEDIGRQVRREYLRAFRERDREDQEAMEQELSSTPETNTALQEVLERKGVNRAGEDRRDNDR